MIDEKVLFPVLSVWLSAYAYFGNQHNGEQYKENEECGLHGARHPVGNGALVGNIS